MATPIWSFSLTILVILFLFQVFKNRFPRIKILVAARIGTITSCVAVLFGLVYYTYAQFIVWQSDSLSQAFLPPYQGYGYFIQYSLYRFWAQYLVAVVVALVFLFLARRHNRKHDDKFFYPEESYFLLLGIFLSGHPLWIGYFVAVIVGYAIFSAGYTAWWRKKYPERANETPRVSFYYGWLSTAILVILLKSAILKFPPLAILIFATNTVVL